MPTPPLRFWATAAEAEMLAEDGLREAFGPRLVGLFSLFPFLLIAYFLFHLYSERKKLLFLYID
jgi:hypothetical protein